MLGDKERVRRSARGVKAPISEIFRSVQGEGLRAGTACTFIRYAYCNLSCSWCDAAYTWKGRVKHDEMTIDEVARSVTTPNAVVTGGEPTIDPTFPYLVERLNSDGRHITVETNGTNRPDHLDQDGCVDLWSVSPKLGSSGQVVNLESLKVFKQYRHRVQWKFVIDGEDDLTEAMALVSELALDRDANLVFQPNGLCHNVVVEETMRSGTHVVATDRDLPRLLEPTDGLHRVSQPYLDRVRWLYELFLSSLIWEDYPNARVTTQAHKLAWGNKRGF